MDNFGIRSELEEDMHSYERIEHEKIVEAKRKEMNDLANRADILMIGCAMIGVAVLIGFALFS